MAQDAVVMFEGTIYEEGYGWVAQKVMRDAELSVQAKAIYSYICSMAGNPTDIDNRKAFPSVSLMKHELGIKSDDTFYKHMKKLKDKGYLKVEQEKSESGKFKRNIYKVVAVPKSDEKKPEPKEKEPYPKKSSTVKPYPNFSSTEKPSTEKWGTNRNSITRNSFNKKEEEISARARDNIAYQVLGDFLHSKGLSQETINKTILELFQRGIDLFTMKDIKKQYEHMMDKLKYEEVDNHNNFPEYFARGIKMRTEQSKASKQYIQEQLREYEIAMQETREEKGSFPFYNWIEE